MLSWPQVSAETAARAMQEAGAIYLDVRTPQEFELGHPQGAYNVPWQLAGQPNPDFVPVAQRAIDRDQALIVGCQSGLRSKQACAALLAAGFANVVEQHGGYGGKRDAFGRLVEPGWERAGLPIATSALPGRSYRDVSTLTAR
jgi:rhodanese-related sulfurtransferase